MATEGKDSHPLLTGNPISVALLRGDDAPDATTRARRVAMGARDEVAVEVHDGLACRLAAIHPHVVAVRLVALLDPGFRQVQNRRQRPLLLDWLRLHNKQVRLVRCHCKPVSNGHSQTTSRLPQEAPNP